jgi:hypothetical protein
VDALVVDGANDTALDDHEPDDEAGAAGLRFEADIVEAAGVPHGHEVAAKNILVIKVAGLRVDESFQGVLGDAAGAAKLDGFDDLTGKG